MTGSPLRMVQHDGGPALPIDYGTEQALLAALLVNDTVYDRVADFLQPEHFADPLHGRIYEAIGVMVAAGQRPNVLRLVQHFEHDWPANGTSPRKYLTDLAASVVTIIGAEDYGRTVLDLWQRRTAMQAMGEMAARFADVTLDKPAAALLEEAEQALGDIAGSAEPGREAVSVGTAVDEALAQIEAAMKAGGGITGATTGIADLDKRLGGLKPANLVIVAGRPSMGKTSLASNIARAVAAAGQPVYWAGAEMAREEMGMRWLAEVTNLPAERQQRGDVDGHEFARLMEARAEISGWPILVDDTANTSAQTIKSRARRYRRRMGALGLVVVDFLQLLIPDRTNRSDNRVAEVSSITRALKVMAKELDCPVIAVSQLSRKCEERDDKRPLLSDLRESGSIEQDADVVIFVYREEYYLERREPKDGTEAHTKWDGEVAGARNKGEIIVAKVRMGRVGKVLAHWNGQAGRWGDLAYQQQSMDLR